MASDELRLASQLLARPERCPIGNQKREGGSVTKVVTIENLLSDQLTVTIENIGGADRDRTDDLLNAIIPNLSGLPIPGRNIQRF